MRITKSLIKFVAAAGVHEDHMLVIETSQPAGWGRPNTLSYCLERPDSDTSYGRVLGTVAAVKAAIAAKR